MKRRCFAAGLAGVALVPLPSRATELPAATCLVPAKPAGGFELTCQLAQQMLADRRAVQLAYQPGGIGALAFNTVATQRRADPGLLVAFSSGSLLNLAQGKFGPHRETDVRWLAVVGVDHGVIAVRKDSPLRHLQDVLQALRADPRSVAFGAGGTIGSQDWFKAALLARSAGVSHKAMRFVAFEGGGEALTALEGGHVQVVTGDAAELSQRLVLTSGVRAVAVLAEQRLPGRLASVPTAREQGLDLVWPTARGFYLGREVSDEAYREWSENFARAMQAKGFAALQAGQGLAPLSLTGPALQGFIAQSMARYRQLSAEFSLPMR